MKNNSMFYSDSQTIIAIIAFINEKPCITSYHRQFSMNVRIKQKLIPGISVPPRRAFYNTM